MEKAKKTKAASKKATVKTEVVKTNEVIVKNQADYTIVLNRILYALTVIGILLALNLVVNLVKNNNTNNTKEETPTEETENTEYDVSEFDELTTSELDEKIKAGGTQVVYIGRPTCGYCVKFVPVMKQVQKDLNYKTIYVDLEKMSSSDAELLYAYDSYIEENFGYTPMVLVFRDGAFVKGTVGYTEAEEFKSFLNEAGIE